MKKLFTLAMAAFAALSMQAGEFTVYENGSLGQNIKYYDWWQAKVDFNAANPDGTGEVLSFENSQTPRAAAASMGLNLEGGDMIGQLSTATLTFDYYALGTGTYTIRLTSVAEGNQSFTVTAENAGKWNTVSYNIAEDYPEVSKQWSDGENDCKGYVFSVIVDKGSENAQIFINNVKYTNTDESWEKPAPVEIAKPETVPSYDYAADNVISLLSGQYPAATTFNIGNWEQKTKAEIITIDNAPVEQVRYFNYLGWELASHIDVTKCDYMHVDYYPVEGTTFGFTPISPDKEKANNYSNLNLNEWNSFDVPLTYWDNVNFADLFQVKFDNGNGGTGYIANVFFYKKDNGGEEPDPVDPVEPDPVDPVTPGATFVGTTITNSYSQTMDTGVTTEYPYTLDYSITYNDDKTLSVTVTYNFTDGEPVGTPEVSYVMFNGAETTMSPAAAKGRASTRTYEATTTQTYDADASLAVHFKLPVAYGAIENDAPNYIVGSGSTSGIEAVEVESEAAEYFNLQGIRVANPENGIFIRRQGNKTSKVIL